MDFLAISRTKLANQRTYMSYMSAGFSIAAISGLFKKPYLVAFGVLMIAMSTVQFVRINQLLDSGQDPNQGWMDSMLLAYAALAFIVLFLSYHK